MERDWREIEERDRDEELYTIDEELERDLRERQRRGIVQLRRGIGAAEPRLGGPPIASPPLGSHFKYRIQKQQKYKYKLRLFAFV